MTQAKCNLTNNAIKAGDGAHPLISVVTVCYNASATIGRTMGSVRSQIFTDYEHLIIDGDSTDGTSEVVASMSTERTHFFSEKDKGIYDAMNKGIDRARGTYLIFLNAGDSFHGEDVLKRYADAITNGEYPGIVYGQTDLVDSNGEYVGPRHLRAPEVLTLESFGHGMVVCHQAFCVLRRIAGFYDLRWRFSADYEWCIRCLQHSRRNVYLGDRPVIDYLSEGVTTANHKASLRERYMIMSHYYGNVTTFLRHLSFIPRYVKQSLKRH